MSSLSLPPGSTRLGVNPAQEIRDFARPLLQEREGGREGREGVLYFAKGNPECRMVRRSHRQQTKEGIECALSGNGRE